MIALPIVERELRVRGRARATYWFRVGAALAASLFVGFVLVAAEAAPRARSIGSYTFGIMAWGTFLYCLAQGVRNTADCLSEEKRAGTLGLLFLTDLRGHDVVLGKLAATSINSFYTLLAVFPPLAIPLVMGGVTAGEFWRLVLVLIVTLLFALAAGLLVSSMARDERQAWGGTVLLTGFIVVLVPLVQGLAPIPIGPTCAFLGLWDTSYSMWPGNFWTGVWSSLLLAAAFLAAASFILPRAWQDHPSTTRRRSQRNGGQEAKARAARARLLDVNPVVWLAGRNEQDRLPLWSAVIFCSVAAAGVWFIYGGAKVVSVSILITFMLLHLALSMWVASEACAAFPAARDTGALELLLSTPLTLREIVDGHLLAMTRLFQRPLLALLAVEGALLAAHLYAGVKKGMRTEEVFFTFFGVGLILLVAVTDLFAVSRFGLWAGLTAKKPGWAVTKTISLVLIAPLLLTVPCFMMWIFWPLLGVLKNLIFMSYAQDQLRRNFRHVLTERYGGTGGVAASRRTARLQNESNLPPVLPR